MTDLAQILDDCLTKLISGEATVEECVAAHPQHADELRTSLAAANFVRRGAAIQPSSRFKARTRAQLIAYANANPRQPSSGQRRGAFSLFRSPLLRFSFTLLLVGLLVVGSGTLLAQAAAPGDTLYPWRIASEEVSHATYPNPALDLSIVERRGRDYIAVAADPVWVDVVRQRYVHALGWLKSYTRSLAVEDIRQSLENQQADLAVNNLLVSELDELLIDFGGQPRQVTLDLAEGEVEVADNRITYSLVMTATGSTRPLTSTLVSTLSPGETLIGAEGATCTVPPVEGRLVCLVENLAAGVARRVTLSTQVNRCFTDAITRTTAIADVTGVDLGDDLDLGSQVETDIRPSIELPFPGYSQLAYVRSNSQTHDLHLLPTTVAGLLHVRAAAPAWSPDGRTLAFVGEAGISDLGGVYSQGNGVWLLDMVNGQGQNPRQLVALDHIKNIAWSPDGSMLAFEVGEPDRAHHDLVIVKTTDGQEISRFSGEQPAWRADSQRLVTKACNPGCGLWEVDLDGAFTGQLTFGDSDSFPALSLDDNYLAFSSAQSGDWEIYLLRLADSQLTRVTNRSGSDTTPVFGLCHQEIYLRTDHFGDWRITAIKLDGSEEQIIQENVGQSDDWGLARPAVYPRFFP